MHWIVYFFRDDKSNISKSAYNQLSKIKQINLKYITKTEILCSNKLNSNSFYVVEKFEGEIYNFMKNKRFHILSPLIVLNCLERDIPLPISDFPLMNLLLRDKKVAVIGIHPTEAKEFYSNNPSRSLDSMKYFEYIEMLNGIICERIDDKIVDIIVVLSVREQKYRYVFIKPTKFVCVAEDWLETIWNHSKNYETIHPFSSAFIKQFEVPLFYNLNISLTGFTNAEKQKYIDKIKENGGCYFANLEKDTIDCLIAKNSFGMKFNFGKLWKISIVSEEWIISSLKYNQLLPYSDYYYIDTKDKLFTNYKFSFYNCSNQFCQKYRAIIENLGGTLVEFCENKEQMKNVVILVDNNNVNIQNNNFNYVKSEWLTRCVETNSIQSDSMYKLVVDDNDDVFNDIDFDIFEDNVEKKGVENCKIFRGLKIGFYKDKVLLDRKYIEDLGGTIVKCDNSDVTHVIVQDGIEITSNLTFSVKLVKEKWLKDCLESKMKLPEEDYKVSVEDSWISDIDFDEIIDEEEEDKKSDKSDGDSILMNISFKNESEDMFSNCKIAFKNCPEDYIAEYSQKIRSCGGKIGDVNDADVNCVILGDTTHGNFSQFTSGLICVNKSWIDACFTANQKLGYTDYIVDPNEDEETEELYALFSEEVDSKNDPQVLVNLNANYMGIFAQLKFFIEDRVSSVKTKQLIDKITINGGFINPIIDDCDYLVTVCILPVAYKNQNTIKTVTDFFILYCVEMNCLFTDISHNFLFRPIVLLNQNTRFFIGFKFMVNETKVKCVKETLEKILVYFGGEITAGDDVSGEVYIIRTNETECVLSSGAKYIVDVKWIELCLVAQRIVDKTPYIFKSREPPLDFDNDEEFEALTNDFDDETDVLKTNNANPESNNTWDNSPSFPSDDDYDHEEEIKDVVTSSTMSNKIIDQCSVTVNHNDYLTANENSNKITNVNQLKRKAENIIDENSLLLDHVLSADKICDSTSVGPMNCSLPKLKRQLSSSATTSNINNNNISNTTPAASDSDCLHPCKSIKLFHNYYDSNCSQTSSQVNNIFWNYRVNQSNPNHESKPISTMNNSQICVEPHTSVVESPLETGLIVESSTSNSPSSQHDQLKIDQDHSNRLRRINSTTRIFDLSAVSEHKKSQLAISITKLGGNYSESDLFNKDTTHLLMDHLSRSEKLLSAMVSKCWVLHSSYVLDSESHHEWLPEANYEWGKGVTLDNCGYANYQSPGNAGLRDIATDIMAAIKHWKSQSLPAFHDWRVVLIDTPNKMHKFSNLLKLGGAKMLSIDNDQSKFKVTHHIIETNQHQYFPSCPIDPKCNWLKPSFLLQYLMYSNRVDVNKYLVPQQEIKQYNITLKRYYATKK